MVEDRVTDGRRIAQLFASEIRGRSAGPLGAIAVVDVHDADGSPSGQFAYGLDRGDERLAAVYVHANRASLAIPGGVEAGETAPETASETATESASETATESAPETAGESDVERVARAVAERTDLSVERTGSDIQGTAVSVDSGAAVKRALTVLEAVANAVEEPEEGRTGDPGEDTPE